MRIVYLGNFTKTISQDGVPLFTMQAGTQPGKLGLGRPLARRRYYNQERTLPCLILPKRFNQLGMG
ncbi:MAG: hypothetical protein HY313_09135 [Acidobacteria bacterium]|nr:hypothetical protein [Acidobacteriota bacterium]